MRAKAKIIWLVLLALLVSAGGVAAENGPRAGALAGPVVTAFTYQGWLRDVGGRPLTALCDFRFTLWSELSGGVPVGAASVASGVGVAAGYFTVPVNAGGEFGAGAFTGGAARWLQVEVRCSAESVYTLLTPRQAVTPVPFALALPGVYTQLAGDSLNLIAGASGNNVSAGVLGATISGGGNGVGPNRVTESYGTVGGGMGNTAGPAAAIGGGGYNLASGEATTVGGGYANTASGIEASLGGGKYNTAAGELAAVSGGYSNTVTGAGGVIGGGQFNLVSGKAAGILGGENNTASGDGSLVGGGFVNTAGGKGSVVGGGISNTAGNYVTAIGGGLSNTVSGWAATVGGGKEIAALGDYATVGGGWRSAASGWAATAGGGYSNTVSGGSATVGGGGNNIASGGGSTVGGGGANIAGELYATVAGGAGNWAAGPHAVVAGGNSNRATGAWAVVSGGGSNTASGSYASVGGGADNLVMGDYSFGVGRKAVNSNLAHRGVFLFADANDFFFASTAANQFRARATGGVQFVTAIDAGGNSTQGVEVAAGGGSWASLSDRNLKANFVPVDGQAVLARVAALPLSTWNYKAQDPAIRHIGPMAQDFYAAFGVGEDDTHITTIDADGVALAAIQGLNEVVEAKEARIAALEARVLVLERQAGGRAAAPWMTPWPWLALVGLGFLWRWRGKGGGR